MRTPPTCPSSPVIVEVLLLSELDGRLLYRRLAGALRGRTRPGDLARRMSGLTPGVPGAVLHSTSWRHEDGAIVLTYAALPDPLPCPGRRVPVRAGAVATGGGPLAPSPAQLLQLKQQLQDCLHSLTDAYLFG